VLREAGSLRDGRATLTLPGGLRWVAAHQPDAYDPPNAFADELTSLPLLWRHTHQFSPSGNTATLMTDVIETPLPARVLRSTVVYRHRQLAADLAALARAREISQDTLTVAVTGSSGLIGTALTALLTTSGHRVVPLVRRLPRAGERYWRPEDPAAELLDGVDAVIRRPVGRSFAASVRGRAVPATARALLAAIVRYPWSTAAVSTRIRWQVGTGWGELAIRAARRGATVRTITISREQQALAARRVAEAGLAGQVSAELRDYRDVDGRFDAICSVEMLEAVGERYWDGYFAALDRYLAPGGRIGLQTITMAHDRMLATRHTYTWIQNYIFPDGLLPSVTAIQDSLARTTLRITGREDFGAHYAETRRIWRERFGARADEVARLGFDEVFNRMWTFYLCYSEAGFRAGYIDVSQLTLARI
jgi:cyclopropane fatty-acyl-phospholipid synthase-like methyltransferase